MDFIVGEVYLLGPACGKLCRSWNWLTGLALVVYCGANSLATRYLPSERQHKSRCARRTCFFLQSLHNFHLRGNTDRGGHSISQSTTPKTSQVNHTRDIRSANIHTLSTYRYREWYCRPKASGGIHRSNAIACPRGRIQAIAAGYVNIGFI